MKLPEIPPYHRANRSRFSRWLGRTVLSCGGWRVVGELPADRHLIIVGGPHTSNWDFVYGMAALLAVNVKLRWLGKHTIFRKPFGPLMTWLGGIPVNRTNPVGVVEDVAGRIRAADAMIIAITPEGTRKKVIRWKTGFLRIAQESDCRLLIVTLDFGAREIRLVEAMSPGEDPERDISYIRDKFAGVTPRNPQNF